MGTGPALSGAGPVDVVRDAAGDLTQSVAAPAAIWDAKVDTSV